VSDWPTDPGPHPPTGPGPPPAGPVEPSAPPPSPTSGGPSAPWLVLAVGLVIALLAASVGVIVWRGRVDDGGAAAPSSTTRRSTTTEAAEPTPTTGTAPPAVAGGDIVPTGQAEVDATLAELAAFVERERGLEFRQPVRVELAADDAFEARLLEDFERDAAELTDDAEELIALGFIDRGTDLAAELRQLLRVGVLGFYDPETDELVVRGVELTPYTRRTIVHELTHALDDQWFDLDRPEYDDRPDEISFGFSAVVEGSATRVETAYEASLSPGERAELRREEMAFALDADVSGIPLVLLQLISAPYEAGEDLVDEILASGGDDALARALTDPPTTSEQVLDFEAYEVREPARAVTPPPVEGEPMGEGVFGQLMLELLLDPVVGMARSEQVTDDWAGDWYVSWRTGDRSCVRLDVAMETATALEELHDALGDWARTVPDARIERPAPDLVRVTSCA